MSNGHTTTAPDRPRPPQRPAHGDPSSRGAAPGPEAARILSDCRDLFVHRMRMVVAGVFDRMLDQLFSRAERSVVRDEINRFLEARALLQRERGGMTEDFEQALRKGLASAIAGEAEVAEIRPTDGSAPELSLVAETEVEEGVAISNLVRELETLVLEQMLALNARVGALLNRPGMESPDNPFGARAVVGALAEAWRKSVPDADGRSVLLRQLSGSMFGDVASVYADLNRHLVGAGVLPEVKAGFARPIVPRGDGGSAAAPGAPPGGAAPAPGFAGSEAEVFTLMHQLVERIRTRQGQAAPVTGGWPGTAPPPGAGRWASGPAGMPAAGGAPAGTAGAGGWGPAGAGGFAAGAEPAFDARVGEGVPPVAGVISALTEIQHGAEAFPAADGRVVAVPTDFSTARSSLRELHRVDFGAALGQDTVTIELVAMVFDFVFVDRTLANAIKGLLGRMQIPVLKAAMLDKAFFSQKNHPARLLVNSLAEAGLGWQSVDGEDDPLFRKIESIVDRVQNEFVDDLAMFTELREELERFLAEQEQTADTVIQPKAEEIERREQEEIARTLAGAEIEQRIAATPTPTFLAEFLRTRWIEPMLVAYREQGEDGEGWKALLATMDDLVWSAQPKLNPEERRKLVALLPDLLKRLHTGLSGIAWEASEREQFMVKLVECHAAAVKASLHVHGAPGAALLPSQEIAVPLAVAPSAAPEDDFDAVVSSLKRGMWLEITQDDDSIVFAKLAWVSPLRGKYLFTNRQGERAFSLSREEIAQRFREDRARIVEAEPLLDRAFSDMMNRLTAQAAAG